MLIPSNSDKCLVCRVPLGAPRDTLPASLRAGSASLQGAPSGLLPPPRPAGGEGRGERGGKGQREERKGGKGGEREEGKEGGREERREWGREGIEEGKGGERGRKGGGRGG